MAVGDVSVLNLNPNSVACAKFDGVDDSVVTNVLMPATMAKYSIAAWIRNINASTDFGGIFCARGSAAQTSQEVFQEGTTAAIQFNGGNGSTGTGPQSTTITNDGEWHHVCVTADSELSLTRQKLFIDGVLETTGNSGGPYITTANTQIIIGNRPSGGLAFKGNIRDVRFYDTALTSDEVAILAIGGEVARGLVNKWPLKDDANDAITGTAGVLSGAVLVKVVDVVEDAVSAAWTSNATWMIANPAMSDVVITTIQEF